MPQHPESLSSRYRSYCALVFMIIVGVVSFSLSPNISVNKYCNFEPDHWTMTPTCFLWMGNSGTSVIPSPPSIPQVNQGLSTQIIKSKDIHMLWCICPGPDKSIWILKREQTLFQPWMSEPGPWNTVSQVGIITSCCVRMFCCLPFNILAILSYCLFCFSFSKLISAFFLPLHFSLNCFDVQLSNKLYF